MTTLDIYLSALDRQTISKQGFKGLRCIKFGRKFYKDDDSLEQVHILEEGEKTDSTWALNGQVTRGFKFKFRIRLLKQLLDATA